MRPPGSVRAPARDSRDGRTRGRGHPRRCARDVDRTVGPVRTGVRRVPRRADRPTNGGGGSGDPRRGAPKRGGGGRARRLPHRLRAGPRDASATRLGSSTHSPMPMPSSPGRARPRSGSCSTPTTSGTTPTCSRGSPRTPSASPGSMSATGRRSIAPTGCFQARESRERAELVGALAAAGWDGALDVEIFSTPDLFWGLPVAEAAQRAHAAAASLL